jgi:hypothetical protein
MSTIGDILLMPSLVIQKGIELLNQYFPGPDKYLLFGGILGVVAVFVAADLIFKKK